MLAWETTVWSELMARYPDWQALQGFLESEEGGFIRVSDQTEHLCILRYDKAGSLFDLPHVRWFRSVVWDKTRHCPVAIAPPKATAEPFPHTTWKDADASGVVWEEYRDGFMVQCFRLRGDSSYHIASRSSLTASGTFYSPKTFRALFLEALEACGETVDRLLPAPDEEKGEWATHVSFLVQHPEHRMVSPVTRPYVYPVHFGVTQQDGKINIIDHFPGWEIDRLPATTDSSEENEIQRWCRKQCNDRLWEFRGIVAKDQTGQRWRFHSEKYAAVRSLRGNEASPVDRYTRLFSQNLSPTYLEYYAADSLLFSLYTVFMNHIIQSLYATYIRVFVRKTTSWADVPKMYHPHLYAIHGMYLAQLRPQARWVTPQDVRMYLFRQPPPRIAFLIRKHQEEYYSRIPNAL